MSIITASISVAHSIWLLLFLFLFLGFSESVVDVGGNTLLIWLYGSKVAPYLNGLYFGVALGAFLSPLIIAQLFAIGRSVTSIYLLMAIAMVPVSVWLMILPSPQMQVYERPHLYLSRRKIFGILLLCVFLLLTMGSYVALEGWVFSYIGVITEDPEKTTAYLTAAYWGSLLLSRFLSILFAAKIAPKTLLLIDTFGCAICISTLLVWPNTFWVMVAGVCGVGFFIATIAPTTFSMAEQFLQVSGQIAGWLVAGISVGAMLIPWMVGQFFESTGPQALVVTVLFSLIIALAILILFIAVSANLYKPSIMERRL
jgi:fucose permease